MHTLFVVFRGIAEIIGWLVLLIAFCLPTHHGWWWLKGYYMEWGGREKTESDTEETDA